jgi:hypothetical protein
MNFFNHNKCYGAARIDLGTPYEESVRHIYIPSVFDLHDEETDEYSKCWAMILMLYNSTTYSAVADAEDIREEFNTMKEHEDELWVFAEGDTFEELLLELQLKYTQVKKELIKLNNQS